MILKLTRLKSDNRATIGVLELDDKVECFTLEDAYHETKVKHKTRIPIGTYEIKLRDDGGMNVKYHNKFDFHKGMLHLQNVNNFEWVYIHIGNYDTDTSGCILVGNSANLINKSIGDSTKAYKEIYYKILKAYTQNKRVRITIIDEF